MLDQLLQLELGELHKAVDFVLWSVEVLNAKCVDCNDLDATLVAYFEDLRTIMRQSKAAQHLNSDNYMLRAYPCHRLKPQVVALNCLDLVGSRISPVSVHHESNMLRDRSLL